MVQIRFRFRILGLAASAFLLAGLFAQSARHPVSGRLIMQAPWIVILVLSLVGFAIGAVEAFRGDGLGAGGPQLAGVALAVFGVMLVMSVYFIFWNRDTRGQA